MRNKPIKKNRIIQILRKINIHNLKSEKIDISKSLGRILSKDISSPINLPPFNNSAVDGFALHKSDISKVKKLKIKYRVAAGDKKKVQLRIGEVARIFTGAKMPENSSTVVMQENTIFDNSKVKLLKLPSFGENCRKLGEDIKKNKYVLRSGEAISKTNISLLAAVGQKTIFVKKKIKIGFFTSGNELKDPSDKIKNSQIYNSNKYTLLSLLKNESLVTKYLGTLKDTKKEVFKKLNNNINKFSVIITTGGASVGEEDHLVKFIKEKGKLFFWKIAIKPGRPLAIGKVKNTIIICLPGNPVSVFLLFGMLIKPFLLSLCGSNFKIPKSYKGKCNFEMKKKTARMEWLRVKTEKNAGKDIILNKFSRQGSGIISSISYADGIIEIPENVNRIKKGDIFDVYFFENLFN